MLLCACIGKAFGQESKTVTANMDLTTGLQKIVRAYPSNFYNIQGGQLSRDGNSSAFASRVCFTGAVNCEIRKYASARDKSASWTCLLFESEEFSEAAKVYRNTCSNIRKTTVDIGGGQSLGFSGSTSAPDENLRFTGTNLKAACKSAAYLNLVAAVELVNNFAGWEVRLNLYSGNNARQEE